MVSIMVAGAKIYTPNGIIDKGVLATQGARIAAIVLKKTRVNSVNYFEFPANYHVIPGFIDLHVHGSHGSDVMDATPAALIKISHALAAMGTTGFLATTMTASASEINAALHNVAACMQQSNLPGAQCLGVHLEGPFISANKAGAQAAAHIQAPNIDVFKQWQQASGHAVRLVTLAPEIPDATALIAYLVSENIIASMGHTDATFAQAEAAIHAGCHYMTHLFNACRAMHHREPGVVTAALLADQVVAELIVDGVHLHPAIIKLALRLKKPEKLVLVSDAMRATCLGDGQFDLGGQAVSVEKGVARLADGALAGSTLTMPQAVRNMLNYTDCTLQQIIQFACTNPANVLGLPQKGKLAVGMDADFVVLDDKFDVVMTVRGGEVVYAA